MGIHFESMNQDINELKEYKWKDRCQEPAWRGPAK